MFDALLASLRRYWRRLAFGLLIALLGLLFWQFQADPTTRGADIDKTDTIRLLLQLRGARPPPDNVAIVDIVEPFDQLRDQLAARPEWRDCLAQSQGQPVAETNWPRCAIAILLDKLTALGATDVVFDVFFDNPNLAGQDELEQAIRRAGNIILQEWCQPQTVGTTTPFRLPRNSVVPVTSGCGPTLVPPLPKLLAASDGTGPMLLLFREDVVTRNWSFAPPQTGLLKLPPMMPMVAFQAAHRSLFPVMSAFLKEQGVPVPGTDFGYGSDARGTLLNEMMRFRSALIGRTDLEPRLTARVGETSSTLSLSLDDQAAMRALLHGYATRDEYYLNYYGPTGTVPFVTADDILSGRVSALIGWTVFVGSSVGSDSYPTPYTRGLADNMPGVEIAATAFANLRTRQEIAPLPEPLSLALIVAMGLLAGIVGRGLPPLAATASSAGIAAAYFTIAYLAFTRGLILIPVVTPLVAEVIPGLGLGVVMRTLSPRSRTFRGIALQTDIQGSMAFARRPRFKNELRRYYRDLGRIVARHGGTLVRASDDSSMSYWRDSRSSARSRERACLAALELREHFCDGKNPGTGRFPTRIGLHAGGPVTLSGVAVGEAKVANVTGDVANTAARLQELCKLLGTWALASVEAVTDVKCVEFRRIGRFRLVGRDQPIEVVEILAEKGRMTPEERTQWDAFRAISADLAQGDHRSSVPRLEAYARQFPADNIANFLCRALRGTLGEAAQTDSDGSIRILVK